MQTLIRHSEIQNWVSSRHGMPAITQVPDGRGDVRSRLALSFGQARRRPGEMPTMANISSPVSWKTWFAELDRQHLALQVSNADDFEFVEREDGDPMISSDVVH